VVYSVRKVLFLCLILTFLGACSSTDNQPTPVALSITGSVNAPAGGDVTGSIVFACANGDCNANPTFVAVQGTGATGTFTLSNLKNSSYKLVARKDVNANGQEDAGDYKGEYASNVTPSAQNINIQLEKIPDDNPGGGGGGNLNNGTISGVIIPPGSIDGNATSGAELIIRPALQNDLRSGEKASIVSGEVIVQFVPGARLQSLSSLSVGTNRLQRVRAGALSNSQLYRSEGIDEAATLELIRDLEARPDVLDAHPNWTLHAFKAPNDSLYPLQWHYTAMNLPPAWDTEDGVSPAVVVSVVDTGIVSHPDLVDRTLPGYDFISDSGSGGDGDERDDDPNDEGGDSGFHGSHVAGTVGATTNNSSGVAGVNWGARILPVRVLGVTGSGSFDDILAGVAWAAGRTVTGAPTNTNKAQVINLSLGGNIGEACPSEANTFFSDLAADGIIVVVAAGNDDIDADTTFPANCDGVITVGATGLQNDRAPYSNFGTTIDIMAPGGDTSQSFTVGGKTYPAGVLSTLKDGNEFVYGFYQGTSMASPHVAGLVSLMLAKDGALSFDTVLARLKAASTPLSEAQCGRPTAECGAGLVDAAKALGGGGGSPPPPPPPPTEDVSTYVLAFYCLDAKCDKVDQNLSKQLELTELQDRTPYQIRGLARGSYLVGAWQDLNGNIKVDGGEPLAAYSSFIAVNTAQNVTNINLRLEPYNPALRAAFSSLLTKNNTNLPRTE
jgi:serine protease